MKRSLNILFLTFALALAQMACSLPSAASSGSSSFITVTPMIVGVTTATPTLHPVITATANPNPSPTHTRSAPAATATTDTRNTSHGDGACTYKATFVGDATIPDDTVVEAGSTFVKTWMVSNNGTCTWGPNGYALHALAFTGGSQMGAPAVIPLHSNVAPGETIDVSVTLTAPTAPGTYTSSWMFRVDNDPNGVGPNLGLGLNGDQPLYTRIQVSGGLTRLQFEPGTTTAIVTGSLGANETVGYLVTARQDQVIIASTSLDARNQGVRVKITTSDNVALLDLLPNLDVAASLPETRDYIVWVSGGGYATSYHLAVTIPIRITFAPGTVSASLDGSINNGREIWYVLRASAGQTLTASLDGSNADLIIAGLENSQVLTAGASDETLPSWTGTLPATQNYTIKVAPRVDSITYTLHVKVQ